MVHIKPQIKGENFMYWEKMGKVCFISSVSAPPTFRIRREEGLYITILQAVEIDYVSIDEGTDVVLWRGQDQ